MTRLAELVAEALQRHPEAAAVAGRRPDQALDLMGEAGRQIREAGWEAEALVLLRHAEGLFANSPPGASLVLTVPPRIATRMHKAASVGYRTTRASITALVASANREVLLMAPYCHPDVVSDLAGPINDAIQRGARVTFLLRADPQWDNGPFAARLEREVVGKLDVREVDEEDHMSHAKVVVVDSCRAYVGSGNLTPHGYGRNFEAGVLVQGTVALSLRKCLAEYERMARIRPLAD